jgi:hypothetical protein
LFRGFVTTAPIDVFLSYASEDEELCSELKKRLKPLLKRGLIGSIWDRHVVAGAHISDAVRERLDAARMIILLISADFLACEACDDEMTRALERRQAEAIPVVPILLRDCMWRSAPLEELAPLPPDGKFITSCENKDRAWTFVEEGLSKILNRIASAIKQKEKRRQLTTRLENAINDKEDLKRQKASTKGIDQNIKKIKWYIRQGGILEEGDILNERYVLEEQVGTGGFGYVWKARDRRSRRPGRTVAVKVLHANVAKDHIQRERFFRGARMIVMLKHEAVVRVIKARGNDSGFRYIVMEFMPGGDLHRAVLDKKIRHEQIIPILLRVGRALAAGHKKGMIHRDVTPTNILLDASQAPFLTDFDLVAAMDTSGGTRTGGMLGTFLFAAPEQLYRPQEVDASADVYGLGMTAIFAFHGAALPYDAVVERDGIIEGLACGGAVKAVLKKAIARNKDARFADAGLFCDALEDAVKLPERSDLLEPGHLLRWGRYELLEASGTEAVRLYGRRATSSWAWMWP